MIRSNYETSVTKAHVETGQYSAPNTKRFGGPGTRRKNPARYDQLKPYDQD